MDSEISVEISRIYISFFNRAADPDGLQYWVNRYNEAVAEGRDGKAFLEDIADSFAQSPEAKAIYETTANPTDAQIEDYIKEAYDNMFGRQPDEEGLAYWVGRWKAEIAEGKPGVRVLFEIENAARGSSNQNDVDALQNKAEVAAKFTNDFIASGAEWTDADFSKAKDIVDGVDHTPESVQQAEEKIVEFIQEKTDPDGGQAPGPANPGPVTPPPLSEAVNALNGASTVDAVLDILEEYKDALFGSNSSYLLFDALPDGAGRQQAIALGILEQQSYFGKFTSDSNAQATVDLFTKTESNKAAFITAIDSAGSQEAMVSALSLSQALADDRQNLINQWGTSSSATARARAAELQTDSYTVQMSHLAAISGEAQLNLIASKLLSSPGSFHGVVNIVNALKAIDFTKVNTASGDFLIGGQQYNYIALGTENDDTITFPMDATKAAMNIKLYSEGVEKIWSSHIGIIDAHRTPDIDLKGAMGLKELWTDISSADSSDGVNYTNASFDTVFGVSGSTALYNIIRVRFDNTAGENNAKFAVSESKPGSYFTTGDIDDVEQITFDIREGNEGGRIEVHGPDLKTLTVIGNNNDGSGQMEFVSWATKLDLFDASAATADIKFSGPQAAGFQIKGGGGQDTLIGGKGNDIITGGAGNDVLTGGLGDNIFVFSDHFGHDKITDFKKGDKIEFSGIEYSDLVATAQADGTVVYSSDKFNGSVTVTGLLSEDDFNFLA